MNERMPDSSRLPLRATVMVLLFLGVIFLLMGFQAMGSGDDGEESTAITSAITTTKPAPEPEESKADVVVFNTSADEAVGTRAIDRLTGDGFNVTQRRDGPLQGVTETTVFYGDAPGEKAAADEVGRLLQAPVEPRGTGFADEPPGIIVAVTE